MNSLIHIILAIFLAPLLPGIISRVKALFAGRHGQPLLQAYYDIWKLLRKGAVYSTATTWIFKTSPVVGVAAPLLAISLIPFAGIPALLNFPCDLILVAYIFGLMRFMTVVAALDTASAFEGMGASREVQFSALAEPALLLGLATLASLTGELSLSGILQRLAPSDWAHAAPALTLVSAAMLIVYLAENSRIPVDDPNTHLELTMIHEVMVLDHSGPDFGLILYGASLKLWALGAILIGIVLPFRSENIWTGILIALAGMFGLASLVGIIESTMARLRLLRVPQMLVAAIALAALALVLLMR